MNPFMVVPAALSVANSIKGLFSGHPGHENLRGTSSARHGQLRLDGKPKRNRKSRAGSAPKSHRATSGHKKCHHKKKEVITITAVNSKPEWRTKDK